MLLFYILIWTVCYLCIFFISQAFNNATVHPSAQATFPYIFAVSKFLQVGFSVNVAAIFFLFNYLLIFMFICLHLSATVSFLG